MDTPFTLALKLKKIEFSNWVLENCVIDFFKKDKEGLLPIHLCISNDEFHIFKTIFEKMNIQEIIMEKDNSIKKKTTSFSKTKKLNSITQEELFSIIFDCIKFQNIVCFEYIIEFCNINYPE